MEKSVKSGNMTKEQIKEENENKNLIETRLKEMKEKDTKSEVLLAELDPESAEKDLRKLPESPHEKKDKIEKIETKEKIHFKDKNFQTSNDLKTVITFSESSSITSIDSVSKIRPGILNNFNNYRNTLLNLNIINILHDTINNLPLRRKNRIPVFATEDRRFNTFINIEFTENPLLDVEVPNFHPILSSIIRTNSKIFMSDLLKPEIWALSLKRFKMGAVQTDLGGTSYIITKDMTDKERILFYRSRSYRSEKLLETQQYIDGSLIIPFHSQVKILQSPYNIEMSFSDSNHPSKSESTSLLKKIYFTDAGVTLHAKISGKIKVLKAIVNGYRGDFYKKYSRLVKSLNYIYHFNPDLANNLATLCFASNDIDINEQSLIDSSVDHWNIYSEKYISIYYPNIEISDNPWIYRFEIDSNIKDRLLSLLIKDQEISSLAIYLARNYGVESHLLTGDKFIGTFLHVMDAGLHSNIPGTFEDNSVFMTINRINTLLNPNKKTIISTQENDFIENILRKIIEGQGFATFQENLESFKRLIFEKTIGEDALWTSGQKVGIIYKLNGTKTISPFFEMRDKYLDGDTSIMEWNFVRDVAGAQIFIGSVAGDLKITFPQLEMRGQESVFIGDSGGELYHQLQFQFYKDGDKFIQIKPGELIKDAKGVVIGAPRFLMLKNQYVFDLSIDSFTVDTVVFFNDLRNALQIFKDKGRNFIVGYHGVHKDGYSDLKIRKIKEAQDKGAAFISGIEDSVVWNHFVESKKDIRENKANPFYDEHFESVFLMSDILDKLVYIINNPKDYSLGFEEIINDITQKGDLFRINQDKYLPGYGDLTAEECWIVAEAFGKCIDANGVVQIRNDWKKWWYNFKNSNKYIVHESGSWYRDQGTILASRFYQIKKFYKKIDPTYIPDWVDELPLEMP